MFGGIINETLSEEKVSTTEVKQDRNSHQRCSIIKCVLRNFKKFTVKHLCPSLSFNTFAGLRTESLLKKDSGTGVFL